MVVIDRAEAATASRVAAGLITPVTGQRLAKTWRLEPLWAAARAFYARVEAETQSSLLSELETVRLFQDTTERAAFVARVDTILKGLVSGPDVPVNATWFDAPHGGFAMVPAGRLDVARYLQVSRDVFARDGGYFVGEIDPERDVELVAGGVRLPRFGIAARGIVFCQGFSAVSNPWFPRVPYNFAKGEILTLRVPGLAESRTIHRGVWFLPIGGETYLAGATYERDALDCEPTPKGREELSARLRSLLRLPFDVTGHVAAVRPIVQDQRPTIGVHPDHPQIGYFNGLGSKGSLQAPFVASQFADFLTANGTIEREIDLARMTR
ncbi:hypothetical protein FRUB_00442 [Fimbriiglobus ruber]|uniref:FAD dependent oxidoreductase domain-containing protein n=1 Tax=Fimbriiglobus ruber TaxID=1908690 RepID=A0A225E0L6_9BACT|nr:hypothetical protein FRUB_00442 [Fimbriiglobus ruber]